MTNYITLANEYYKNKYPGYIIFYRKNDDFVAYLENAARVSRVLGIPVAQTKEEIPYVSIHHLEFLDVVGFLNTCGISAKGILYRNDNGEYDIPDVEVLEAEENMDLY